MHYVIVFIKSIHVTLKPVSRTKSI